MTMFATEGFRRLWRRQTAEEMGASRLVFPA